MKTIIDCLKAQTIGEAQIYRNLTLFPLLDGRVSPLVYLTMEEALAQGNLKITELDAAGHVPQLQVMNDCDQRVLILDGEELIGAKQNRIPNITILLEAHSKIIIPVSCVEAGRWHHVRADFTGASSVAHPKLRRCKGAQVTESIREGRGFASDQSEVWREVHHCLYRLRLHPATGDLNAAFEGNQERLEDFVQHFAPMEGQCGVVAVLNGRLECADIFDQAGTFGKLFPKLVRSYALDAIAGRACRSKAPDKESVTAFLQRAGEAEMQSRPSVGVGQDCRLSGPKVQGAALVIEETVVHLSLFAAEEEHRQSSVTDMASPSRRRRIV